MPRIVFDQPFVRHHLRRLGRWALEKRGWRVVGELPPERKFLAILAPHTSNWDFPVGIAMALQFKVRVFWLGKHTLFN